jgi:hypothetical protein
VARQYAYYLPTIKTTARIIFIASCYLSEEFKSMWDIGATTEDRVLIVPEAEHEVADLRFAALAWVAFVEELSRPSNGSIPAGNVDSALAKANAACPECTVRNHYIKIGGTRANRIRLVR